MQYTSAGPALLIHGGAGTIRRDDMTPEDERMHSDALRAALDAGWQRLNNGAPATEAAVAAVRVLEDCPLFNAGRGSVFNHVGEIEMDAALMDGRTLAAGAVAEVQGVRNPITLAREVMAHDRLVFLAGRGAESFAREKGVEFAPAEYFFVQRRYDQLRRAMQSDSVVLDHDGTTPKKYGTVGCVALDAQGNLAAGTSTGGLTNKRFGRIGDTPVIGAGTYADNRGCAVSCTGIGEAFIRTAVGHELSARVRLLGQSMAEAAAAVMDELARIDGEGGFIALDAKGNFAMPFNTEGMYRAWRNASGEEIGIYG